MKAERTFLVLLGALLGAGLIALGVTDYLSVRREFRLLLRDHATAIGQSIAATVRLNRTAAATAEEQLGQRLIENARILERADRLQPLTAAFLEDAAGREGRYHVTVYDADRQPRLFTGPEDRRHGGTQVVDRLFADEVREVITPLHLARYGGEPRMAAGVRRQRGGAIVLNADASVIVNLQRTYALDALLAEAMTATAGLAYIELTLPSGRTAAGDTVLADAMRRVEGDGSQLEHEGDGVIEVAQRLPVSPTQDGSLRVGLRTDSLRAAVRRTIARLAVSLSLTLVFIIGAFSWIGMSRAYGALSAEHDRAVAALAQRDRLSAMGELAAGVAHEVRNPLNAIAMTLQRLRREFLIAPGEVLSPADHEEMGELLSLADREARRVNDTVQQFLEFARPPALTCQPVDLGPFIESIAEDLAPIAAAKGIALTTETELAATTSLDPAQVRAALENLVRNAIDATPSGGRVELAAFRSRQFEVIEVRDSGIGIRPEVLPRVFDLYFTTKKDGTGIGLPVAQQVAVAHGGTLEAMSPPGGGTVMTLRLPRT